MKKLSPTQHAVIYLLYFTMSEAQPDNERQIADLIDPVLKKEKLPTYDEWIPDEDGAPINASKEVYKAFNDVHLMGGDFGDFKPLFKEPNPIWDDINTYIDGFDKFDEQGDIIENGLTAQKREDIHFGSMDSEYHDDQI